MPRAATTAPELVVVGSLNADLTARVRRHPAPGETVRGDALTVSGGGKGANQAVAAARLGARTAMVGRVGADAHGDMLLEALRADGVDTTHTMRDHGAPTGTALITVADSGENNIIVCAGANERLSPHVVEAAEAVIGAARVVSLVLEVPVATVVAAARAASEAGTRVVLNLSPVVELPPEVLALADPLVVNEHEARQLLAAGAPDDDRGLSTALLALGVRSAVVTLGERGAVVAESGRVEHVPAVPTDAVDTTGAGDAFAATAAWRLGRGDALPDAARWASRVSARCVREPGAQPSYPTLDAVAEAARC
ncbi:ribokinase [Saccharopolyspora erythraea NRRL 2338]|uniref:Ribokinase n=2 Tax=Saccharopolyspora erythraea TaxID=1836 RepID=A4FEN4_SACEN|nr:ribokinase [Saccharopolyspora erythraea]EQD82152.1 ribokinase [Saccharopolyspora erythraea D]PFG96234.1 ribokinase [Saccharopolyspora erythraea NRRL 2338]QRK92761.1 ribokinase [Saccharopolyspora erythraea]CAM02509.1 sugar kinase in PfkB family [Saccharopolyspora erythraea NRRL 2338]